MEKAVVIMGLRQYDSEAFRCAFGLIREYRKERPYPVVGEHKSLPYTIETSVSLYQHAIVYETPNRLVVHFQPLKG